VGRYHRARGPIFANIFFTDVFSDGYRNFDGRRHSTFVFVFVFVFSHPVSTKPDFDVSKNFIVGTDRPTDQWTDGPTDKESYRGTMVTPKNKGIT
jgi:hypothetical protein